MSGKQYGLIIPKKAQNKINRLSFLSQSDSDSDEEPTQSSLAKGKQQYIKKQTRITMEKALAEDPTVYDYDAVYDKMAEERQQRVGAKKDGEKKKKESKYVTTLLAAADRRKREQEILQERKYHREIQKEGEMYADKETFVTSAYRKKMDELQQEIERQNKEAAIDALTDVTKQKDLSGFYRHLYRQTVTGESSQIKQEEESPSSSENPVEIKQEPTNDEYDTVSSTQTTLSRPERKHEFRPSSKRIAGDSNQKPDRSVDTKRPRQMRGRERNSSESSEVIIEKPKSEDTADRVNEISTSEKTRKIRDGSVDTVDVDLDEKENDDGSEKSEEAPKSRAPMTAEERKEARLQSMKRRNFGEAVEAARQRYLERKQTNASQPLIQ